LALRQVVLGLLALVVFAVQQLFAEEVELTEEVAALLLEMAAETAGSVLVGLLATAVMEEMGHFLAAAQRLKAIVAVAAALEELFSVVVAEV
jgi:predicted sugar kinase